MIRARNALLAFGLAATFALGVISTDRQAHAQAEPVRLKGADLAKFLENLGYTPEKVGDTAYRLTLDRESSRIGSTSR
jgi:hypothetical protein